jgi:hypothetical protein
MKIDTFNNVLEPMLVPLVNGHQNTTFQQDNARPHKAAITKQFSQRAQVDLLQWLPCSPDLSPIEHA